jgi:predicted protein tyrosine phosphatase
VDRLPEGAGPVLSWLLTPSAGQAGNWPRRYLLGPGHHDVAAAARGADEPLVPLGNGGLGTVPFGHFGSVRLDPVAAAFEPVPTFAVWAPASIRLNFCLACQPEGEPMSTSRTALRITICGIPELGEYSAAGVTHVLSFLGPNSPDPPGFTAFAPHRRLILRFHDVIEPQPDQIAPTREDVERLLLFGREVSETPKAHLLVHCRAGVSRSTAAATLILMQANPEWPASAALDAVAAIRPYAWPNLLILEFGDALLGRNGEISDAAGAIYRRVLARDPEFVDQMIDAGRDREVRAAYREAG